MLSAVVVSGASVRKDMDMGFGRLLLFPMALGLAACATQNSGLTVVHHDGVGSLGMRPARIAVLNPPTEDPMLANAYARLNTGTSRLFQQELGSAVLERSDLPVLKAEQRWQYLEPAAEETSVALGRLLGADALMLYRIKIPELRERLFAREGDRFSPITISGKVMQVSTGEKVWSHVVTVEVSRDAKEPTSRFALDPAIWSGLVRAVNEMLTAVSEAIP
jgi:hypothetical protein